MMNADDVLTQTRMVASCFLLVAQVTDRNRLR